MLLTVQQSFKTNATKVKTMEMLLKLGLAIQQYPTLKIYPLFLDISILHKNIMHIL